MRLSDEQLQQQLADAVGRTLAPHMGRARRAFLDAVAQAQPTPTRSSRRLQQWMSLGLAAAAAVLAVALRSRVVPYSPRVPTGLWIPRMALTEQPRDVRHTVLWQPIDEQTVYVNGQVPARSIRGVRVDEVQWFDPRMKAHVRLTVPREQVVLTSLSAQ